MNVTIIKMGFHKKKATPLFSPRYSGYDNLLA